MNMQHIESLQRNLMLLILQKIYDEILALPLFPNISKKHQDAVIRVIKSVLSTE